MLKKLGIAMFILGATVAIGTLFQYTASVGRLNRSENAAWRRIKAINSEKAQAIEALGPNHEMLRQYDDRLNAEYNALVRQYDDRLKVQHDLVAETLPEKRHRAGRGLAAGLLIGVVFCLISFPLMMTSDGILRRTLIETVPVAFFGGAIYAVIRVIQKIFDETVLDSNNTLEIAAFAVGFFVPQFLMFSVAAYFLMLPFAALIIWNKEKSKT